MFGLSEENDFDINEFIVQEPIEESRKRRYSSRKPNEEVERFFQLLAENYDELYIGRKGNNYKIKCDVSWTKFHLLLNEYCPSYADMEVKSLRDYCQRGLSNITKKGDDRKYKTGNEQIILKQYEELLYSKMSERGMNGLDVASTDDMPTSSQRSGIVTSSEASLKRKFNQVDPF
ncbi:unnamed protein product [Bursaphelenchus okinawaensis]|uniref:Uncharacterized protein n=1 Tax=Bursaphelenchus okinawaensis TaxID=465554 RepID=A0A811L5D7_9BILA|nr:unnamed protein product [Bursaphelenchus okinawaensis]CAG9117022.1 unnamed protein product [Bursaphelenchus okinawaensis]